MKTYRRTPDTTCLAAEVAGGYGAAGPMHELERAVDAYHDVVERLLRAWLATGEWGGLAGATGLPADGWLHLEAKLPPQLASQLRSVGDRLVALPHMAAAFAAGAVTFHQLGQFVRTTRDCNGPVLARLDEEMAGLAYEYERVGMDPDQLGFDTQALVDDLRAPGWAQRQERRDEHGSEVRIQGDFDGGIALHGSFTPLDAAPVVAMVEALAGPPTPDSTRAQQRAEGLVRAAEHLLGDDCDAAPSRPTMTVVVDLATATPDVFGRLLKVATARRAPTLSARACDALAETAELRLLLADGRNPLAEVKAADIPVAVRRSVLSLHGECAQPGCHRPAAQCDLNHLRPRAEGGGHEPANLAPACRADHVRFHDHDWTAVKDRRSGMVTFTHRPTGRTYSSLPDGARPPPWDRDQFRVDAGLVPPIPPPPLVAPT